MERAFKLRWTTDAGARLDASGEWHLRFRDHLAYDLANKCLSRNHWIDPGHPISAEKLFVLIDNTAPLSKVLESLIVAGIPRDEIEIETDKPWQRR